MNNGSETDFNEKTAILLNKISKLEHTVIQTSLEATALTKENELYKSVKLPILVEANKEKELLIKNYMLEKLKLDNDLRLLNSHTTNQSSDSLKQMVFSDTLTLSKLEFYKFQTSSLKEEVLKLKESLAIKETKHNSELEIEREKNTILARENEEKSKRIDKLCLDIKNLAEANKNLLIEIQTLNSIIDKYTFEKQMSEFEKEYYKKEITQLNKESKVLKCTIDRLNLDYKSITMILDEYKSTISDLEISNYIFEVVRVGMLIQVKTDVRTYT